MESILASYVFMGLLLLVDAKQSYKCSDDPDYECIFPFNYDGVEYNECANGWHGPWCHTSKSYEYCILCEDPDTTTTMDLINATSAKTTQSADSNLSSTVRTTANKASMVEVGHHAKSSAASALRSTTTVGSVTTSTTSSQTSSSSSDNENNSDAVTTTTTNLIDTTSANTVTTESNLSSTVRMTPKPVTTNKASTVDVESHIKSSTAQMEYNVRSSHSSSFIVTSTLRSTTTVSSVVTATTSSQTTSRPSDSKESGVSRCSMNKEYPCLFPFEFDGVDYYECTTDGSWTGQYWCSNAEPTAHFAYCEICDENEVAPENPITRSTTKSPTTDHSSASLVDGRLSSTQKDKISSTVTRVKPSESPSYTTQLYSPKSKVLLATYRDAKPDSFTQTETQHISMSSGASEQINSTPQKILRDVVSKAFVRARPTDSKLHQQQIASSPNPDPTSREHPFALKSEPATESSPQTQSQDQEAKGSLQIVDLQTLKSAEDFAVSTTDKISPAIITTQKAVDPRLAKVPTQRNSASDNYNGDEGSEKANDKPSLVTIILIVLLLLVIVTGVSVIVLCLRRRRLRASKHQQAEVGESGDNLLKQNGSDKEFQSISADGSQEMQPLHQNCCKTMPGDDVVIKDGTDSKIDRKATVTV